LPYKKKNIPPPAPSPPPPPWMDHEISIPRIVDFIQLAITSRAEGEVCKSCSIYKQMGGFVVLLKNKPFF